jgi:hypothetical protein
MTEHTVVTPRDILGVPMLPPGTVSAALTRVRARLRRLTDNLAPPPVQILESLFGTLDHRVLVALCELGIPDHLHRPTPIDDLARAVGADAVRLERLLRFAAARGWVRMSRGGLVSPTGVTRFLRTDHPGGWRAWVEFAGSAEAVAAIGAMSATSDTVDAYAEVNGAPFFEWMARNPDRWAVFDRAMAAGGRMHALTLAAALDWSFTRAICDVGGGTGALLATLLGLLPDTTGTLVDLPAVIDRSVDHPRLTCVAGDAFESVPSGHDTYLLVNVLHDWNDRDATRLLTNVARASAGARIVVVEADHPDVPYDRVATGADILMAGLTNGGRERTAAELAALGREAGTVLVDSTRLASGDWAHTFVQATASPARAVDGA